MRPFWVEFGSFFGRPPLAHVCSTGYPLQRSNWAIIENRPQNGHQHPFVHVLPGVGSGVAAVENKDGKQLAQLWRVDCYTSTCQLYGREFYVVPIFQSRYRSHTIAFQTNGARTLVCDRVQPGCGCDDVTRWSQNVV